MLKLLPKDIIDFFRKVFGLHTYYIQYLFIILNMFILVRNDEYYRLLFLHVNRTLLCTKYRYITLPTNIKPKDQG